MKYIYKHINHLDPIFESSSIILLIRIGDVDGFSFRIVKSVHRIDTRKHGEPPAANDGKEQAHDDTNPESNRK